MTVRAIVFCQIEQHSMSEVIEHLKEIPQVKKVMSLTGEFDAIAEVEVSNSEELYEIFVKEIDLIKGITVTNTHMVMKSWEK